MQIKDISKQFGETRILDHVSFTVGAGEITGLVGKNGSGKTTLLKIIRGEVEPDDGKIRLDNETIGYLPQNPLFGMHETVKGFLSKSIAPGENYRIDMVMERTGLTDIDRDAFANSLSGGQKTRLFLASLLISQPEPSILLLDEPTNSLDVAGFAWLEDFLLSFPGGVLLVSHDRTLLDNTADKIIELNRGSIKTYGGNYSFYRERKEAEKQAYERMYSVQQKKIERIERDIISLQTRARQGEQQFGSGSPYERRKIRKSAEQSVHRKRKLEKFLKSETRLEKPEEHIKHFITLSGKTHPGKTLLYVKGLSKSFGKPVLSNLSFHIGGQERVWLAGANGSGKSTLLQILAGRETQGAGTIETGNGVKTGYYSQDQQELHEEKTILEVFLDMGLTQTDSYKLAMRFGFDKKELLKKVRELSLGQKAKVAFAKLTHGNYHLLLLDEPTNHLDIDTRETIEQALRRFSGGIMVASHDRFFLERIGIGRAIAL